MKYVKKTNRKPTKVAKATKRYVKKVLDNRIEDKFLDIAGNQSYNVDTTGVIINLSDVSVGDTNITRTGNQINAKSISWRLNCRANVLSSLQQDNGSTIRCIIFADRQIRTSTLPTVADVLTNGTYLDSINPIAKNAKRFMIIKDYFIKLLRPVYSNTATQAVCTNTSLCEKLVHGSKQLNSMKVCYSNTSTGSQKNNIYMLLLSDNATLAPRVEYNSRLIFEDA